MKTIIHVNCNGMDDCPYPISHPQDHQLEDTVSSWLNQKAERLSVLTDLQILIRSLLSTQTKASQERLIEKLAEIYSLLPIHEQATTDIIIWDIGQRILKLISSLTQEDPTN